MDNKYIYPCKYCSEISKLWENEYPTTGRFYGEIYSAPRPWNSFEVRSASILASFMLFLKHPNSHWLSHTGVDWGNVLNVYFVKFLLFFLIVNCVYFILFYFIVNHLVTCLERCYINNVLYTCRHFLFFSSSSLFWLKWALLIWWVKKRKVHKYLFTCSFC